MYPLLDSHCLNYLDPYHLSLSTPHLLNKNPCLLTQYKPCKKLYVDIFVGRFPPRLSTLHTTDNFVFINVFFLNQQWFTAAKPQVQILFPQ